LAQRDLIQFFIDYNKKFLNWLRTMQLCGFHNNSSDLTHESRISGPTSNNKPVAKQLWGCVNTERQYSNTCYNCSYHKTFDYSWQKHRLFKRFTFSVHKAA